MGPRGSAPPSDCRARGAVGPHRQRDVYPARAIPLRTAGAELLISLCQTRMLYYSLPHDSGESTTPTQVRTPNPLPDLLRQARQEQAYLRQLLRGDAAGIP